MSEKANEISGGNGASGSGLTPADQALIAQIPNKQDKDLTATDGNLAIFQNGNTIDAGISLDDLSSGLQFIDNWDASTNTPTLPLTPTSPTYKQGDYYVVTVAGTFNSIDFTVGDHIAVALDNATQQLKWALQDFGKKATQIFYDNTASGSVYTNLQDATDELFSEKVDKVVGKGLSTEDYTTAEKSKLAGIQAGAEVNVQADWNQTDNLQDDFIKNKPDLSLKENVANKKTDLTTPNNTDYPTTQAVIDGVTSGIDAVLEPESISGNYGRTVKSEFTFQNEDSSPTTDTNFYIKGVTGDGVHRIYFYKDLQDALKILGASIYIEHTDGTNNPNPLITQAQHSTRFVFSLKKDGSTKYLFSVQDYLTLFTDYVIEANAGLISNQKARFNDVLEFNGFTTIQRGALSPIQGTLIYNTDTNKLETFDGVNWLEVTPTVGTVATKDVGALTGNIQENGANLNANEIVETDANSKYKTVAKNTAYNKNFGTTAGTVTEGNDARLGTKNIDETNIANGKVPFYNEATQTLKYNYPTTTSQTTITTNTTLTDFEGTKYIDATAGSVVITLPAVSTANAGNLIELKRIDNTSNTVRIVPFTGQTIDGFTENEGVYLFSKNDAIVVRSDGATASYIVSDNRSGIGQSRAYFRAALGGAPQNITNTNTNVIITQTNQSGSQITSANNIITLKGGNSYRLTAVFFADLTSSTAEIRFSFVNNITNLPLPNQNITLNRPLNYSNPGGYVGNLDCIVNSINDVQIRIRATSLNGESYVYDAHSFLFIEQLSTQVNVVNTIDTVSATISAPQSSVANTNINFNSNIVGNIPIVNGVASLLSGKKYYVIANVQMSFTNYADLQWFNANTLSALSESMITRVTSNTGYNPGTSSPISMIIQPQSDINITLRNVATDGGNIARANMFIIQLGSTGVAKNADGSIGGITYSTTEVLTGNIFKSKPVYRKMVEFTNLTGNNNIIDATLNITYCTNVIKIYGEYRSATLVTMINSTNASTGIAVNVSAIINNTGLVVAIGSGLSPTNTGYVIVEYTK